MGSSSLRLHIHLLGALAFSAHFGLALLSYLQSAVLWDGENAPRAHAFSQAILAHLPPVSVDDLFGGNRGVLIGYACPLALASLAVLVLLLLLCRLRTSIDDATPRLLARWAMAFAAVSTLAYPVFTQDFWLSFAWGRMVAGGVNPYHVTFTVEALSGLPVDHMPMTMSWGPFWAILSGLVMTVAGGNVLFAAVLFKTVLATAWLVTLRLVAWLTESRPPLDRCLALVVVGWTPMSVSQVIAEGHNDIVMVALALLWLALLRARHRWGAPMALMVSALSKYVTVSLFLIDAVWMLCRERASWRRYCLRILPALLFAVALVALFYRSAQFFDGVRLIASWRFLHLRDAATALEHITGLPVTPLAIVAEAFFVFLALYWIVSAIRRVDDESFIKAFVTLMAMALFVGPHLWPWYLIWALAPAALLPGWWLSRFLTGVAVVTPFTVAFWWIDALEDHKDIAALLMHAGGVAWALATRNLAKAPLRTESESVPLPGDVAPATRGQ